jgi:hypothetical protein
LASLVLVGQVTDVVAMPVLENKGLYRHHREWRRRGGKTKTG